MSIKHEAKLNALLASRQQAEWFILRIARARPCFNFYKELTHENLGLSLPGLPIMNYYQSINIIQGKTTILDDILSKRFSEQLGLFWLGYTILFHCLQYVFHILLAIQHSRCVSFWCYMVNIALSFALILPRKVI